MVHSTQVIGQGVTSVVSRQDNAAIKLFTIGGDHHGGMWTPEILWDIDAMRRFRDEPMISTLQSIRIVQGRVLMTMGLLEGDITMFPRQERRRHVQTLANSLCRACNVLQEHQMAHFDIKPSNVLYRFVNGKASFYLTDFSLSRVVHLAQPIDPEYVFTLEYRAPEFLVGRKNADPFKGDVWSVGMTILYMATGEHPMETEIHTKKTFLDKIRKNVYPEMSYREWYNSVFKQNLHGVFRYPSITGRILDAMLQINPKDRPLMSTILRTPSRTSRLKSPAPLIPRVHSDKIMNILIGKARGKLTRARVVMAMEMATRALAKNPMFPEIELARAAFSVATKYHDKITKSLIDDDSERKLLETVDYLIYNDNLTNVLNRITITKPSLRIDYGAPLPTWFENDELISKPGHQRLN